MLFMPNSDYLSTTAEIKNLDFYNSQCETLVSLY